MGDIIIFTDGSCSNNGKKNAKGGIGIYYPNKEFIDVSEPFILTPITNQRAELFAIYEALKNITIHNETRDVFIYSDSLYSINSLTLWITDWIKNNWINSKKKPIKNLDIIIPIYKIIKECKNKIYFKHVKAHTNNKDFESICNSIADRLAYDGMIKSLKLIQISI